MTTGGYLTQNGLPLPPPLPTLPSGQPHAEQFQEPTLPPEQPYLGQYQDPTPAPEPYFHSSSRVPPASLEVLTEGPTEDQLGLHHRRQAAIRNIRAVHYNRDHYRQFAWDALRQQRGDPVRKMRMIDYQSFAHLEPFTEEMYNIPPRFLRQLQNLQKQWKHARTELRAAFRVPDAPQGAPPTLDEPEADLATHTTGIESPFHEATGPQQRANPYHEMYTSPQGTQSPPPGC